MKIMFTLIAPLACIFLLSFEIRPGSPTGRVTYNELATVIREQIEQNGFLSSCGDKIEEAEISANGDIQLRCTKKETIVLNIYQLFKTYKSLYGIEIVQANTIRFNLSGNKYFSVILKDEVTAKKVYESLVSLMIEGKDQYSPELPLDINETVDSINSMLRRLSYLDPQIKVNITGTMIITNNNMQFFHFNIEDLVSSGYTQEGFEVNGIEMIPCTYEKVAANNWINFNTKDGKVAYLKFYSISDEELGKLHQLFIHLRSSMMIIMHS